MYKTHFLPTVTLRHHGDHVERYACRKYDLDKTFPEYESFWRQHVVPATQRPLDASHFNLHAATVVVELSQRSYTVFGYLLEAHVYLDELVIDAGPRSRNWYNTIIYAGAGEGHP